MEIRAIHQKSVVELEDYLNPIDYQYLALGYGGQPAILDELRDILNEVKCLGDFQRIAENPPKIPGLTWNSATTEDNPGLAIACGSMRIALSADVFVGQDCIPVRIRRTEQIYLQNEDKQVNVTKDLDALVASVPIIPFANPLHDPERRYGVFGKVEKLRGQHMIDKYANISCSIVWLNRVALEFGLTDGGVYITVMPMLRLLVSCPDWMMEAFCTSEGVVVGESDIPTTNKILK